MVEAEKDAKKLRLAAQRLVLICPATYVKKMLEEGGEAVDNDDEEPIEIVGKKRHNALRTILPGPGSQRGLGVPWWAPPYFLDPAPCVGLGPVHMPSEMSQRLVSKDPA